MSRQQTLQAISSPTQQSDRRAEIPARRCYSTRQIIGFLGISRSTFFEWKRLHRLPWLVALDTPDGCAARYRADLVDRFLEGRSVEDRSRHYFGGRKAS